MKYIIIALLVFAFGYASNNDYENAVATAESGEWL
jgi:hypothetical protein